MGKEHRVQINTVLLQKSGSCVPAAAPECQVRSREMTIKIRIRLDIQAIEAVK